MVDDEGQKARSNEAVRRSSPSIPKHDSCLHGPRRSVGFIRDSISLSCRNLIQRTATVAPSAQHCAISVFIHTFRTGVHCISTPFADLQHIFRVLRHSPFQSLSITSPMQSRLDRTIPHSRSHSGSRSLISPLSVCS